MRTNKEIEQQVLATIRAEYPEERQKGLLTAWDTYKHELLGKENDANTPR